MTVSAKEWDARKSVLTKIPPFVGLNYKILYPDPPWSYRDKANSGDRGASHKYDTLSLLELKMMRPEIDKITAADCALCMWATAPMMGEARELMAAWGFKYSTILMVWIKTVAVEERLEKAAKKFNVDPGVIQHILQEAGIQAVRPRKGMGNWTRGNAEFLLLGTRGKMERVSKGVGSVVISEPREHSRKPEEARERLVELFGEVPRLEMFSRETAPGWDCWGLEAGKFDDERTIDGGSDEPS